MAQPIIIDDRTKKQVETHTVIIGAIDDRFSHTAGVQFSYCGWACRPEQAEAIHRWVESRPEMVAVGIRLRAHWPKMLMNDHYHLYAVHDGHIALKKGAK